MNKPAGCLQPSGYVTINLGGQFFKAHRLAFIFMLGEAPPTDIDHVNGIRNDNRWVNLRPATRAENVQNVRKARAGNKVGLLGVSAKNGRFYAQIRMNGKNVALGYFDTPEEASAAYVAAKRVHHRLNTL